jgi:predicted enzyme related to lactoylglutathione lyase
MQMQSIGQPSPLVVVYVANLESAVTKVVAAGGQITRDIFLFREVAASISRIQLVTN